MRQPQIEIYPASAWLYNVLSSRNPYGYPARYGKQSRWGPVTLFKQVPGNALNGAVQNYAPSSGGGVNNAYNGGAALLTNPVPPIIESSLTPGILVHGAGGVMSAVGGAHAYFDVPGLDPTSMDYTIQATFASQASELWLDFECANTATDNRGCVALINLGGFYAGVRNQVAGTNLAQSANNSIPGTFVTPNGGPPVYYVMKVVVHHNPHTVDVWAGLQGGALTQYLAGVGLPAASTSSRRVGIGLEWLNGNYADQWAGGLLKVTSP